MRLPAAALALATFLYTCRGQSNLVYSNNFQDPVGTKYFEWSSSPIEFESKAKPPGLGTLAAPAVTNSESPNGLCKFLGEFGGPMIGAPGDAGYNHTRVEQTVTLLLTNLPDHTQLEVSFDLLILKSWDGNSPMYGSDRWSFSVEGGPTLLATTFSNNPKTEREGSYQDYPKPDSLPHTGAASVNTLGYKFFGDSVYALRFTFSHTAPLVRLNFASSLFEGKGTPDEGWGLDNVRVIAH